jgi:hypothetical protein
MGSCTIRRVTVNATPSQLLPLHVWHMGNKGYWLRYECLSLSVPYHTHSVLQAIQNTSQFFQKWIMTDTNCNLEALRLCCGLLSHVIPFVRQCFPCRAGAPIIPRRHLGPCLCMWHCVVHQHLEWASDWSVNTSDFYLGGARFKCQLEYWPL